MDLFKKAKSIRLRSHHDKYLLADDDQECVSQERNGTSKRAKWTVELLEDSGVIRLKSCYGKYLTASNIPFLFGVRGRKVLQSVPKRLDSSVEWEPIRDGVQVMFKTRYGQYLRANGGVPPWRNQITHDAPHHRAGLREWVLWDVDIAEIRSRDEAPVPPPNSIRWPSTAEIVSGRHERRDSQETVSSSSSPPSLLAPPPPPDFDQDEAAGSSEVLPMSSYPLVSLFVDNLPTHWRAPELRRWFSRYCRVSHCFVPRNLSKRRSRFGFVRLDEKVSADKVIRSTNGRVVAGKKFFTAYSKSSRRNLHPFPRSWPQRNLDPKMVWRRKVSNPTKPDMQGSSPSTTSLPPPPPIPEYFVPDQINDTWLQRSLIATLHDVKQFRFIHRDLYRHGLASFQVRVLGGDSILITFATLAELQVHDNIFPGSSTKSEGRLIVYSLANDNGEAEEGEELSFTFKGNGVEELKQKLEEETGLNDILVCSRNPLNGKLYPLRLHLPPNNANMRIVVVPSSAGSNICNSEAPQVDDAAT